MGAVNGFGYQELPAACGARYAMLGCISSWPIVMMSSALAPRPCTSSIAARAVSSGAPSCSTRRPSWGPAIAYSVNDAGLPLLEPEGHPLGSGLAAASRLGAGPTWRQTLRPDHDQVAAGRLAAGRDLLHGDHRPARPHRPGGRGGREG